MSNLINLGLSRITFQVLADNSQAIHDGFVAEVADYPAPNPTMPNFQLHIDALEDAITAWGPEGARGGRIAHDALIAAVKNVKADLKQLASYAMATMPNNPDSWRRLKFTIKRPRSTPKPLKAVQNFRRIISDKLTEGTIKLRWKRPLDSDPGDVKVYIIQYSNAPVQPAIINGKNLSNVLGIITETSIIIEPPYVGANYFWVTPFNAVGYGVSSDLLQYNNPGRLD